MVSGRRGSVSSGKRGQDHSERGPGELHRGGAAKLAAWRIHGHAGQSDQHLKPKVYYPGHLTDVAQAGSALYHKLSWRDTAYSMGFPQSEWPEFRLQIDPNDFLVPQVFNPSDERWSKSRKAEDQIRSQCR
jgi:hypothetical protein